MPETEQHRGNDTIPRDDIVAQTEISKGKIAYLDGNGVIHVGPPLDTAAEDQPLYRDYSLLAHEAVELGMFITEQF